MGMQDFVRFLLPKEDHFYAFLEQQATLAERGAELMARLTREGATTDTLREALQAVEHEGDAVVHAMEEALAKTFVTPIDREDLQQLSSELDDVLDLTNGAARACSLMGVHQPTTAMRALIEKLHESTQVLAKALPSLRKHAYNDLIAFSRELRKLEKDADQIYRDSVRAMFADPAIDAKMILRDKEVLDDLEKAIDRCEHAGETLARLAIKHG